MEDGYTEKERDALEVAGVIEESTPAKSGNGFKDLVREQQEGICRHCGSKIQQAHKEVLSKHKLDMLQMAAKHITQNKLPNDFHVKDAGEDFTDYANFQKLRYHGLVHRVKDSEGRYKRGHWFITPIGWQFLRGTREFPKYVLVRNNRIVEKSSEMIRVQDVYRSNPEVITHFEYFDDDGQYVGLKPDMVPSTDRQLSFL